MDVKIKAKADMPNLNIKNAEDQIILLRWSLENNFGHHWECF